LKECSLANKLFLNLAEIELICARLILPRTCHCWFYET